jgi:hypothetical protein
MKSGDLVEWDGLFTEYGQTYVSKYYLGLGIIIDDNGFQETVVVQWLKSGATLRCIRESLRIATKEQQEFL